MKDCDVLDECVEVLEVVDVVLTDTDTVGDFVAVVLAVCETDTVEDFELVWLSVATGVLEGAVDDETEALGDRESELALVIDGAGVSEILCVTEGLPDTEAEPVSL